ncbi:hypothetical protein Bca52824_075347 [Brassica carinata]|uniref:Uncharacterized protein n=1 Tax=Brassica carinata TaxID=52824 RepID=A0A8X7PSU6_BRACI|nr:hypothetical protein Bca52824_075347 [Brassica carinata]
MRQRHEEEEEDATEVVRSGAEMKEEEEMRRGEWDELEIDPVEAVVVMEEEVVTEMENVRVNTRDSWNGGGCGYSKGGVGGGTVEVAVNTGVEVVVVMDTKVVVDTEVDTF